MCTLIAGLATIVAGEAFVSWVLQPHGSGTFGFGLIAYAGVDHERGPAFVGTAVLALFVVLSAFRATARSSAGRCSCW